MIADSNIIIYSGLPQHQDIRDFIAKHSPGASAISQVEVLGFSRLTPGDKNRFERFFATVRVFAVTDDIIKQAVALRQQKKMSLGDSIIAATCLVHNLTLVTRNTDDFDWIVGLKLHNPFV